MKTQNEVDEELIRQAKLGNDVEMVVFGDEIHYYINNELKFKTNINNNKLK